MSFYDWLLKFKEVDLPIGDLAKDAEKDDTFPKESVEWNEIEKHLSPRANESVMDVAQNDFNYYSADMLDN
ncbi:YozE family protein [Levilactobacillus brevis]|uniref:YozE family protein n=1 Tax=Levilactobacillus brevis TaxID=1580 RepID=UPI0012E83A26|nr:YozE family protein [Levilactobacillus brevis]MUV40613.1 hypothetical protein [Levilactobacillus brevis]